MTTGGGIKEYGSSTFPCSWEIAIDTTETMITSWKNRHRQGNMCEELIRLEDKITKYPELFTSRSSIKEFFTSRASIKESLGLFLYRHRLLDAPSTMLENDMQLVGAVFGRVKLFGGLARTVLDQPLALKATENYFHVKDPSFVSAAERAMPHSTNASVHGNMWETMMPPVFIETLKA
ncbi:hypothetical protein BGW38_003128 [Lunasporangiospora selenospora]|uniref:Uncharacterized protein n=1 Tax=Lunasporangiospora selenospora TaxID=979761 RepID=A0A9P6FR34_9FUNG|nr:hypothetical protein BGW38_003128 [Lunasporangiospora selenospora]